MSKGEGELQKRSLDEVRAMNAKIQRLERELSTANQHISRLEGRLQEIGSLKSHIKKVVLVHLRALDGRVQNGLRLRKDKLESLPTLISKDSSVEDILRVVKDYDRANAERILRAGSQGKLLNTYIRLSRGSFKSIRKGLQALRSRKGIS